ncbi:MAG TPA: hypothetical protein VHL98_14610 [Microvirga sp.]|jgi:hypothetical protein|nr:hypothetical protein [Microvirga sp.]
MEKYYTTRAKADAYDSVIGIFNQMFKEVKELGKKKPESTLNPSKVKIINRVLADVRSALEGESTFKYLDLLDDELLPQYSDAILIMSQYEGALNSFRERHFGWSDAIRGSSWFIKGE